MDKQIEVAAIGSQQWREDNCRHEWNYSAGEADELFLSGRNVAIRCVKCGADGDA